MTKPNLLFNPKWQINDPLTLQPLVGGKVFIYAAGTTTKITTYTDATLATPNANPVILDSNGSPSSNSGSPTDIYVTQACKVVVTRSTDTDPPANAIWTEDNVTTLGTTFSSVIKTGPYTVLVTDINKLIKLDASGGSFTISLSSASTVGDGFNVKFKRIDSSSNTVNITPNGTDNIDGVNSSIVSSNPYDYYSLDSDGTQWLTEASKTSRTSSNKTSAYTVVGTDNNRLITVDATSASFVINLSSTAILGNGFGVRFKKTDSTSNTVTITPSGVQTIDGVNTTIVLRNQNDFVSLQSNGTGWFKENDAVVLKSLTPQIFTSSGTYTPSVNMIQCVIECIGAGGGGGGSAVSSGQSTGGGGGGGAYSRKLTNLATIGSSQVVTISNGGNGATAGANNGGSGGATSVGTICTAPGGSPGIGSTANQTNTAAGAGGIAGTGDFSVPGEAGNPGTGGTISTIFVQGGRGGGSVYGGGGAGGAGTGGNGAGNYGGGGGGGNSFNSSAAAAGGAGTPGIVIITEFVQESI